MPGCSKSAMVIVIVVLNSFFHERERPVRSGSTSGSFCSGPCLSYGCMALIHLHLSFL